MPENSIYDHEPITIQPHANLPTSASSTSGLPSSSATPSYSSLASIAHKESSQSSPSLSNPNKKPGRSKTLDVAESRVVRSIPRVRRNMDGLVTSDGTVWVLDFV
jgi:hypothetical protein